MITNKGMAFFLNRIVNNQLLPINEIVFGNGYKTPSRNDKKLHNQQFSKNCTTKVDLKNKRLIFSVNLSSNEIENIREIGIIQDGELLTRDLIENVPTDYIGNIDLEYIVELEDSCMCERWIIQSNSIYYKYYPDLVKGVTEVSTNSGYKRANSINDMGMGSYFYDQDQDLLYIQTTDGISPNEKKIRVINK